MKLAWTVVTIASFAALPVVAQDTDTAADAEDIETVVTDVLAQDPATPTVVVPPTDGDLPVTLPDPAVPPQGRLDTPEAVFIADALASGEREVASASLARDRSDDAGVKALAERIEADHRRLNDRLRKLRQADAAVEPRGTPEPPEMARLRTLEGEAFDAAWLALQERDHRRTIDKFERASTSPALDTAVRSAAATALTTRRDHAEAVAALRDSLGFE